jgi:hypothetical protein
MGESFCFSYCLHHILHCSTFSFCPFSTFLTSCFPNTNPHLGHADISK